MDEYSYSSVQSSPRSTTDTTWNDDTHSPPLNNYKIKLMCSYGGKIQPRQHDNQLTYVSGDTKIFAVDRNIKFSLFLSKLSSLSHLQPNHLCFKYQLPGEDLDALISVTNDEDLEHMMLEYDRLYRASLKPVRLRLFLFPIASSSSAFSSSDSKSDRQWFVDALNSVQNTNHHDSLSSPALTPPLSDTPDFLFGFDKDGHAPPSKDRHAPPCEVQETVPSPNDSEIQRQIRDLERIQISNQENLNIRDGYYGDFYGQKMPENVQQPANYWQERHVSKAEVYQQPAGNEQPCYILPATATGGMYQTQVMRPVTGQIGQGYYGMQRMVPEVYREQQVYSVVPQQPSFQPNNIGAYTVGPGVGNMAEHYGQVGYDATGRQVYYTTAVGGVVQQQFQAVEGRQAGGELNQESR